MKTVYQFSIATITHDHKLSGLNYTHLLSSQYIGGQKSSVGLTGLPSRCQQGAPFLTRAWHNSVPTGVGPRSPSPCWLSAGSCPLPSRGLSLILAHCPYRLILLLLPFLSLSTLPSSSFTFRNLYNQLGPSQIIRIIFSSQGINLLTSVKSLLPCKVTCTQVPGVRAWTSQGAMIQPPPLAHREPYGDQKCGSRGSVTIGSHFSGWQFGV